jgi:two-component system sensor histidine kinase UhpB
VIFNPVYGAEIRYFPRFRGRHELPSLSWSVGKGEHDVAILSGQRLPVVESIHRQLARDLHDEVAQTLTTMIIQIENYKADQQDRADVVQRLSDFQDTTRDVLNELRVLLFELRGESAVDSTFVSRLKSIYGVQLGDRCGMKVRFRVARGWPAVIRTRAAGHLLAIVGQALACGSSRPGARADIDLSVEAGQALMVVRTGGWEEPGEAPIAVQLHAIRQRVITLGGTVSIRSEAGELALTVAVPIRQLVATA